MFAVEGLVKRFAGVHVLHGVSFAIRPGEILGYLGPNGSGKSTTIKIIAGLLEPTLGTVRLNDIVATDDPVNFRRHLGYVPEEPTLYTHMTAPEYLLLVGRLRAIPAARLHETIDTLLVLLDLIASRGAVMSAYSKGMRQRVLLAAALLHDPPLLVLDEPFSGLDVNASRMLVAVLRALAGRGRMILLSSHRMDVVESLCNRVVILHKGRVVAEGTPRELETLKQSRSLDEVFAQVTEQEDYDRPAEALIDAVSRR